MIESVKEILEHIDCEDEEVVRYGELDDAIIGYSNPWDTSGISPTRLIYSYEKCINILCSKMEPDDALEWMSFNIEGIYLGPTTPIIMYEC